MKPKPMKLNLKQTIALDYLEDNATTEVLFGGGAGGGKSILGCYFLGKAALKFPESRWVMGRASMKTLKETTYISFLKMAKMQGLKIDTDFQVTSPHHKEYANCILFPNKSVILMKDLELYPSDPNFDELGSLEITGGFIDEANQVTAKAKNILASRMRHNITEYGIVPKLLMTCNPAKNWAYQEFYRPSRDGTILPYRKFVQSLVTDNPDIDPTYVNNLRKLDEVSKQRLLYGNWEYDDDPAALMDYDSICDIFTNTHVKGGDKKISCDVARLGGDRIVIIEWDGWRGKVKAYNRQPLDVTGALLEDMRYRMGIGNSDIIVDEDGVGGGIVDFMKFKGFVNNSTALPSPDGPIDTNGNRIRENYDNLKSQCYFRVAQRICRKELYLDCEDITIKNLIIEELEQVKQKNMDKDAKKGVVPKDQVKERLGRSPDFADAIMMREYFELVPKVGFVAAKY